MNTIDKTFIQRFIEAMSKYSKGDSTSASHFLEEIQNEEGFVEGMVSEISKGVFGASMEMASQFGVRNSDVVSMINLFGDLILELNYDSAITTSRMDELDFVASGLPVLSEEIRLQILTEATIAKNSAGKFMSSAISMGILLGIHLAKSEMDK